MAFDPYNPDWSDMLGAPRLPGLPGGGLQQSPVAAPKPADDQPAAQKTPAEPAQAAAPTAMPDALANPPALANVPMAASDLPNSSNGSANPSNGSRNASSAQPPAEVRDAIVAAANKAGIDPAYALATAQRETNFNPNSGGSGSISGLYQMTGGLRRKYSADGDAAAQSQGFGAFTRDLRSEMASRMGREPTWAETYMGHHFGGTRAARMLTSMDPNTPVEDVFTPTELRLNPHIVRAGTVGRLRDETVGDMQRRMSAFQPGDQGSPPDAPARRTGSDFAGFGTQYAQAGTATDAVDPDLARNYARNKAWAKDGNYSTDLGDREPAFRDWVKQNKVPFDPDQKGPADYDMRGFYQALQGGDARAKSAIDPNDQRMHYPDYWKTPYHETFSSESQWAAPGAPSWNDHDQLVAPDGKVLFDDRARPQSAAPSLTQPAAAIADFSHFGAPADEERAAGLDSLALEGARREQAMQPMPDSGPARDQYIQNRARTQDQEMNGIQDRIAAGTNI